MDDYGPLLAALLALLAGLTIGKAWERYKLRGGKWIDRRRARESPHYILGLNFLVANQIDLAIEELTRAASLDADALEVHMILGNLYREKGQVGKAITVHQALLQRSRLTPDRARLRAALSRARLQARRLRRSGARSVQRGAAARSEERVRAAQPAEAARGTASVDRGVRHASAADLAVAMPIRRPQSQAILAFLENEIGLEAMRRKDYRRGHPAVQGRDRSRRAGRAGVPESRRRARRRGERAAKRRRSGRSSSRSRPTAPTWRSTGSRALAQSRPGRPNASRGSAAG